MRLFFLLFCSVAFACTDFVLQTQDGTLVNGRSLEFATDLKSVCKVFPRSQRMASQNPQRKKGVEWISKYGFVGVTALGMNFSFDGMNEKGLSFGYLWLPGYTEYQTVSPDEMRIALDFADFGAWALGNFSTVAEVKEALKNVRIWGHPVPPLPGIPPIHVALHDAKGNHLVVEFIKGEVKVYDNPNGVLTNSPPFDWQLTNLSNYVGLRAINADPIEIKGMTISPPGQGSGLMGLPGDWSPPSRFVKITTYLRFAQPAADAAEGVNLAEHLLNSVDIPKGDIQEKGQDGGDYTQWTVIKDLSHRVFYFRSYQDLCLKRIDLKKLDFDVPSKGIPLDIQKGTIDVTSSLQGKERVTACN